jgi:hypothetical protein
MGRHHAPEPEPFGYVVGHYDMKRGRNSVWSWGLHPDLQTALEDAVDVRARGIPVESAASAKVYALVEVDSIPAADLLARRTAS